MYPGRRRPRPPGLSGLDRALAQLRLAVGELAVLARDYLHAADEAAWLSRAGDNPLSPGSVGACRYHPVHGRWPGNGDRSGGRDRGRRAGARAGARPPGPAAIAAELLARTRAELPVLAGLGEREELLAAAWLASLRAPRTRRAYAGDVRGWLGWLAERGTDVLDAGRVHVDLWAAGQQDRGAEASTVRRRLSALSSFYRYCAAHDLVHRIRLRGWRGRGWTRTTPPPSAWTATRPAPSSLAADADRGPQALRTAAVIRLLVHNALRVDEASPPTSPTWEQMPATGCCA